jgi:hypothetical protein
MDSSASMPASRGYATAHSPSYGKSHIVRSNLRRLKNTWGVSDSSQDSKRLDAAPCSDSQMARCSQHSSSTLPNLIRA